jgi:transcriptional regulator with XRE-family HTH domain
MSSTRFKSPDDIQAELGERLRRLRLNRNIDQATLAAKAGVSERTVRVLETGKGSTLDTFIRVLKALDALPNLDAIAPSPGISPVAMLDRGHRPERASRTRNRKP